MKASRASSRAGTPAIASPSGSSVGRSLAECTARSTSPANRACSISRTKRALSPPAALARSPEVLIGTSSAPPSASATSSAWVERQRAAARAEPQGRPVISHRLAAVAVASPLVERGDVALLALGRGTRVEAEQLAQRAHLQVGVVAVGRAP